jgi:hypothetical protein
MTTPPAVDTTSSAAECLWRVSVRKSAATAPTIPTTVQFPRWVISIIMRSNHGTRLSRTQNITALSKFCVAPSWTSSATATKAQMPSAAAIAPAMRKTPTAVRKFLTCLSTKRNPR